MKKVFIIIGREYTKRLKKPAFWVITLLVPLLVAALYALPVISAQRGGKSANVMVVDQTGLFMNGLRSTDAVQFTIQPDLEYARSHRDGDDIILFIPLRETTIPHDAFLYYHGKAPSPAVQSAVDDQLQQLLRNAIMEDVYRVEPAVYHSVESTHINLHAQDAATGRESFARTKGVVAIVLAALMTLALILFGVQVMRSVQEEKQNRVAEVIASSVRPAQLLVGKVAGVALAAITQLTLWIILTAAAIGGVQAAAPELFEQARHQQEQRTFASKGSEATAQYNGTVQLVDDTVQGLTSINMPLVAALFVLFFLLGYMLYGSLLAALAARLDSDADALQWTLLLCSPLLLTLIVAPWTIGRSAFLIILPFTAPVAVMLQLPFGVAVWQVVTAALLLLATCAGAAILAARSYRRNLLSC